jgi:hypothetical protein
MLSAATAAAETTIIEYPDHYYVESTGVKGVTTASNPGKSIPPAKALPVTADEKSSQRTTARPVTNFGSTPQPVDPVERRASIDKMIQRLERERSDLVTPKERETPDQIARREQEAMGKQRRINRLTSELQKIPVQSIELSK